MTYIVYEKKKCPSCKGSGKRPFLKQFPIPTTTCFGCNGRGHLLREVDLLTTLKKIVTKPYWYNSSGESGRYVHYVIPTDAEIVE